VSPCDTAQVRQDQRVFDVSDDIQELEDDMGDVISIPRKLGLLLLIQAAVRFPTNRALSSAVIKAQFF